MTVMENVNERFDRMMRGAMGAVGTSHSFTARLMVRIEKEKEMARARKLRRIGVAVAVSVFVLSLASLVLLLTYFRVENAAVSAGVLEGLNDKICLLFRDIYEAITPSLIVNMVVLCLSVFAVLSWDAVLGKFFARK